MEYKNTILIDYSVIKSAIAGEHSAFYELYRKTYSTLFIVCYKYANDSHEASDWCQEAYIKLFNNLDKFDPEKGAFITWAYMLFKCFCIDKYRRKSVKKNIALNYCDECQVDIANKSLSYYNEKELEDSQQVDAELMLKLIDTKLNDLERTIFNRHVIDSIQLKDIAVELKMKASTIRGIHRRSRIKLIAEFEDNKIKL
jgi:RNA polymerase sigma-70 factor (ECF subfamily)